MYIYGLYNTRYYPNNVKKAFQKINLHIKNNDYGFNSKALEHQLIRHSDSKFEEINLAGCSINIDELESLWINTKNAKLINFEVFQSMHRFHWILDLLAKGISEKYLIQIIDLIMIWNELFNDSKNKVIWQPYNVSERIINVVLFWNFLKENNLLTNKDNKKLENFIITHLRKLIYNIEYPATGIVNNHLINNARAFYLAGCFINNDSIINLGKEVLYNIIPKIISDNGVLNESSVHYQLLITRSICEIKIISSDQKDKTFYNWITKIAKLMNSQSLIMIPPNISNNNNIPRIGDISPDISIDWYLPNTTKYKTGWNKLWNYKGSYSYDKNANNNYVTNGWLIWENAIWWLISFLHPDKDFYPKGHGHEDYSSFCLYYNSEPLFIDIGRISYDKILLKKGISGREAKYHNCILIDGQAILNKNNYHLSKKKEYLFPNFIRWQVNNNKITYNRLISNSETLITIEDQFIIGDSKHHTIEGRFNIDAYWSIELIKDNKIYIINKNNIKLIIKFSGTNCINIINTNDFPQYGVERVIKSIVWKYKTTGEKNFNVKTEVMVYNG